MVGGPVTPTGPSPAPPGADVGPGVVARRLEAVRDRIASATADPGAVTLVAVTKGFGPDAVSAAVAAGIDDIGENYAEELLDKAAVAGPARWHFLGRIQRNKVARLAPVVSCWQGMARPEEAVAVARRRPGATVRVEVDMSGHPGRNGCPPEGAAELVATARDLGLDVAGLMTVAAPGPPEAARAGFGALSRLADRLALDVRSMGMSDDLEVALSEGSTMVRVGRALFGDRPARHSPPA